MRSQGPYFVFNQEELKVLGQDGWLTGEELRTGSYARGFTTPEGAREAQVALPVIEQSGTCIIRHKTLVKLQEFPEAFNISYGGRSLLPGLGFKSNQQLKFLSKPSCRGNGEAYSKSVYC